MPNIIANKVVNVAQVKHRSPLRYPGGKTWLVPRIFSWLLNLDRKPTDLIEPFCGGAIVGLTVAFENLAERVTLVEMDEQVAAIWQVIINEAGGGEWLAGQVEDFVPTPESVETLLAQQPASNRELAFQAIVRNRTSRGGIMAKGAGKIKHGEAGKGISSRWYAQTIARRIRDIAQIRERLNFIQGDGLAVLARFKDVENAAFFIDPPYTAGGKRAGSRLYNCSELDHEALFELTSEVSGDFLMTYDNAAAVVDLAVRHGFDTEAVAMKSTHHAEMTELLIGRNLDWAR